KETSYQKLVETAHEGIWMVDVDDRSTFVNQHMADLLGYSVEEMLGRSPSDFYFSEAGRRSATSTENALWKASKKAAMSCTGDATANPSGPWWPRRRSSATENGSRGPSPW